MKRVHRALGRDEVEVLRRQLEERADKGETNIGRTIRDMRLVMRMSQAEYASLCGVAQRVLSQIESGDGNPGFQTVQKLLAPFGYRLGVVTGGESVEVPAPGARKPLMPSALAMVGLAGGRRAHLPPEQTVAVAVAVVIQSKAEAMFNSVVGDVINGVFDSTSNGVAGRAAVRVTPGVFRESAVLHLLEEIDKLGVVLVYAAQRVGPLPTGASAGVVEREAEKDAQQLMRRLMNRVMEFGRIADHGIVLGVRRPRAVKEPVAGDDLELDRDLSLHTLRSIKASPKGARPAQMEDLIFYSRTDPRLIAAEVVGRSLLAHLAKQTAHRDPESAAALSGWRLADLVEPTAPI